MKKGVEIKQGLPQMSSLAAITYVTRFNSHDVDNWETDTSDLLADKPLLQAKFLTDPPEQIGASSLSKAMGETGDQRRMRNRLAALDQIIRSVS